MSKLLKGNQEISFLRVGFLFWEVNETAHHRLIQVCDFLAKHKLGEPCPSSRGHAPLGWQAPSTGGRGCCCESLSPSCVRPGSLDPLRNLFIKSKNFHILHTVPLLFHPTSIVIEGIFTCY